MINFILPLINTVVSAFSKGDETRQAIKKIKNAGAIKLAQTQVDAKIKQMSSDAESAGTLDEIALKNVGWKDEYFMIIITLPMILAFIPEMVTYVEQGFAALENMPEYYQYMVGGVFIYVFGFKRIVLKVIQAFIYERMGRPVPQNIVINKPKPKPKYDDDDYERKG